MHMTGSYTFFVIALILVAKLQPYKQKRTNTVDIIMLLAVIAGSVVAALRQTVGLQYPSRYLWSKCLALL